MEIIPGQAKHELAQYKVFLLVFLASVLLVWIGPYGNIGSVGTLDPWIYTGYFLHFNDLVARAGHTYYVSRAPYVYLGVALYSIFTPLVANLLLKALLWTGIAAPLVLITRKYFGLNAALIAWVATFANPYLGMALSWDYPDGPAISFTALGLWLALAPPSRWPPAVTLMLAGACWTMAAITNMIAVLIVLSSVATVIVWRAESLKQTFLDLLAIGAGAIAGLGVWSTASWLVLGQWNILGPQLAQIAYAKAHPDYLQDMWGRGYAWLADCYRLFALPIVLLASAVLLTRWQAWRELERRALLGSMVGGLAAAGLFAWQEFVAHKVLLRVSYHSSYLALPTLLALAVVGGLALRQPGRWPAAKARL